MPAGTYWYKFTSGNRSPAIGKVTVQEAPFIAPFSDDDTSVHVEGITDLWRPALTGTMAGRGRGGGTRTHT